MDAADFHSSHAPRVTRDALGFVRVAACSPELRVADVTFNTRAIIDALQAGAAQGAQLMVFPELCLTGYSCGDLFFQSHLLETAKAALMDIAVVAQYHDVAAIVGLPLAVDGRIYNCAALLADGDVVGIIPKIFPPTYKEYYELRWFRSGMDCRDMTVEVAGHMIPFGVDLLFNARNMPDCIIGIEICEDLWSVNPPSGNMALAGATLLANVSASNELLSKADYRRDLVAS